MMKNKKLKALAAAFFTAAAFSVSAANPFADVEESSWGYQAVCRLSEEGVVAGYPDGTFRGDKNVTRYEMAEIVGKLLAARERLTAEQQETVDRLAKEYAAELQNLGVRVSELEKKKGNINFLTEIRVQGIDRYDNVYTGDKHYELGTRIRLNSFGQVNDRTTVYGQLETMIDMNGRGVYQQNAYRYSNMKEHDDGDGTLKNGYGDGEFHLNRLWVAHHFGPKQELSEEHPFGPSKNLLLVGQFPVKMGVTGYTYNGEFKGVSLIVGDYLKGGRFTIAHGRATDINYNYTGPMMRGMGLKTSDLEDMVNGSSLDASIKGQILGSLELLRNAKDPGQRAAIADQLITGMKNVMPELAGMVQNIENTAGSDFDYPFTYYPMGDDVKMGWNEDEDIPVTYASYIYKVPGEWEFHVYGMKAEGPLANVCQAYGFAGEYYVTPMWRVHGEFVKNVEKLPLNQERPYGFNYGVAYGTADVRKAKSFSLGVDYIYSQAGTYFGGSSSDIADQYMGHVYGSWRGRRNVPAYIADKMDAVLNGTDSPDANYGGAKFFLAKASYVPMKGLIIDAEYGFGAKDMGGRKMDDMFMLRITGYVM
jgi:hypothetical protein